MHQTRLPALVLAWCGGAAFVVSLLVFLYVYLIRFGDPAAGADTTRAVIVDIILFSVFALHHSLFARSSIKAAVRRLVSPDLERSTYTWMASLLLIAVCVLWLPVRGELYRATGAVAALGYAVQALGLVVTVRSSARLDVLDLAGIRQVLQDQRGVKSDHVPLETSGLYGIVRHPLYFGWVLFVFGTPHMTLTRLLFAAISTVYLAAAVPLEERALIDVFGTEYRAYQARVRWKIVPGIY
jgi:methanethiol S-methyltransferase